MNASPIIFLSHLGLLDSLRLETSRVILPVIVEAEVRCRGHEDPASTALDAATWMIREEAPIEACNRLSRHGLDPGEAAVIAIAIDRPGSEVVLDDRRARREASRLGLTVLGTLAILIRAKHAGQIASVRPLLPRLLGRGMFLSQGIINKVLLDADEPEF